FLLHRFEERPKERQGKKAPGDVSQRCFELDLLLFLARRVANGEADRKSHDERAENRRHGIFAQKQFRALARVAGALFRLRPSLAGGSRNLARGAARGALCAGFNLLLVDRQRSVDGFVLRKIVVWIDHTNLIRNSGPSCVWRLGDSVVAAKDGPQGRG